MNMTIFSVHFLWPAGEISLFSQIEITLGATDSSVTLRTPILCNMEHAKFVDVSKVDNGWHILEVC